MIWVDAISKRLANKQVLDNVCLRIPTGCIKVILGASGSGKSVLMKHIIGLLRPDSGRIWVDNQDITQLTPMQLLQIRRKFGMVFQQAALFDSLSVFDNIAFPLREHTQLNRHAIAAKVAQSLAVVGLSGIEKAFPNELSGGMRKRVGLARPVVLDPRIVLYDEPTTGLDPLATANVDAMIMDAKKNLNVTSLVISHDMGSTLRIADEIAFLDHHGKIIEDCPTSQIWHSQASMVQQFINSWSIKP